MTQYYQKGNEELKNGNYREAISYFEKSSLKASKWNKSLIHLLLSEFQYWPEIDFLCSGANFIGEFKEPNFPPLEKLWHGQNGSLLITSDQGVGDLILFSRYFPLLREKVNKLIVQCDASTHNLIKTLSCEVVSNIPKDFDYFCPLMLVFPYLGITPPCLTLPENKEIKDIVDVFGEKPRIGICWTGNPYHPFNKQRSLPNKEFFYGLNLYNLQFGHVDSDFHNVNLLFGDDFLNTAHVIQQMDVIITVCTSIAHIAGSLGKETWLLLDSTMPHWVWGLEEKSVWYPSVKIFRQQNGKWDLSEIKKLIKNFSSFDIK